MLSISAQIGEEFLGTAEELAVHVSKKLSDLGFGERHRATERLVRFYTYENLVSKPERANDDRRKANYGDLQVRQLLLARLLAERGWELDRIRQLLKDNPIVKKLNALIDELAQPSEAERLFFRTPTHRDAFPMPDRAEMSDYSTSGMEEPKSLEYSRVRGIGNPRKIPVNTNLHRQIRDLVDSPMPAISFRKMVARELDRDDLSPEARELFIQLKAFHPTSRGEEPKTERWTRLRLATWCEASFHIDNRDRPSSEEIDEIVNKFRNALKESYLRI